MENNHECFEKIYSQTDQYPNILISINPLVVIMNINKFSFLCMMALTLLVMIIPVTQTAVAENMTSGNTTGQIGGSQAEVEARCSQSPACIT